MVGKIFVLLNIFVIATASPISIPNFDDLEDDNYDIIVDQKQNGSQNFRIRVNGLNVALPADEEEEKPQNTQIQESDLASLLFSGLMQQSTGSHHTSSSHVSNDKNEFADLAALFDWKKKSNSKKSTDTQSRTKDIPTESQLSGDAQDAVRNYVKGTGRKYKLLIGEKYIIPLLQFLKQQQDDDE